MRNVRTSQISDADVQEFSGASIWTLGSTRMSIPRVFIAGEIRSFWTADCKGDFRNPSSRLCNSRRRNEPAVLLLPWKDSHCPPHADGPVAAEAANLAPRAAAKQQCLANRLCPLTSV